jgi:hypothetical protein
MPAVANTPGLPANYAEIGEAMPDLVAETAFDLETMHYGKGHVSFTPDRQVKALMFLAKFGLAGRACAYAGVSFETVRLFRRDNL